MKYDPQSLALHARRFAWSKPKAISPEVWSSTRKVNLRLPGKGNSNSHGARPDHLITTMMKWIRTSRLTIKNSLSLKLKPLTLIRTRRRSGCSTTNASLKVACQVPRREREWESERATECVTASSKWESSEWASERVREREWESERVRQWDSERVREWESDRVTEWQSRESSECITEGGVPGPSVSSLSLSSLELSDTTIYEP